MKHINYNIKNVNIIVEIPKNSYIKYEIRNNLLYVDRFLNTPMPYPFNYGYIKKTISEDGDNLDSIIISEYSLCPKSIIPCKPIGIVIMEDEKGIDNKIICVPNNFISNNYVNIKDINNLNSNIIKKIIFFFKNYKKLDNKKWTKFITIKNSYFAKKEILFSMLKFKNNVKKI